MSINFNEDGMKGETKMTNYIQSNNNGLLVKQTVDMTAKASAKGYSSNSVEKLTLTVSYQ